MSDRGIPAEAKSISELLDEQKTWARNIGPSLRNARVSSGMTQADLASSAGTSQAYLSQIEKGRRTPSLKTLQKLQSLTEGARSGTDKNQKS